MNDALQIERRGAVLTLWLNRPELHNAFDASLIARLTAALEAAGRDDSIRAVVVAGHGASFSAGADMQWMRGMAAASEADNREDSLALARLMRTLDELPKPTLARVHGAAFGGGVGLVACCDIAIASTAARFGLTESRLGLLPAVISPYVIEAIGPARPSLVRHRRALRCRHRAAHRPGPSAGRARAPGRGAGTPAGAARQGRPDRLVHRQAAGAAGPGQP